MSLGVVSVFPDTAIVEVANILMDKHFAGLPVIDADGFLMGIITDHDLIEKGSLVHLPTFLKLVDKLKIYRSSEEPLGAEIRQMLGTKVSEIMNPQPIAFEVGTPVMEVIKVFSEHHRVNPIPVVSQGKLVGIVSRSDLVRLFGIPAKNCRGTTESDVKKNTAIFLKNFEKEFILVSRARTKYWLAFSALFAIIGFLIAFAFILRINY